MPPVLSGNQVVKILVKEFSFERIKQRGSHIKLKKTTPQGTFTTVVPNHKELAPGTLRGVLNLAHVDYKEFLSRVKK